MLLNSRLRTIRGILKTRLLFMRSLISLCFHVCVLNIMLSGCHVRAFSSFLFCLWFFYIYITFVLSNLRHCVLLWWTEFSHECPSKYCLSCFFSCNMLLTHHCNRISAISLCVSRNVMFWTVYLPRFVGRRISVQVFLNKYLFGSCLNTLWFVDLIFCLLLTTFLSGLLYSTLCSLHRLFLKV